MPTSFTTLSVPHDLGTLVRKIARTESKSVVDLISRWAKDAAAELGWDQDFSPLSAEVEWDGAEFVIRATFFGEGRRDFTPAQARSLACSIADLAEQGGAAQTVKAHHAFDAAHIDLNASGRFGFTVVMRKGTGIILRINDFNCSMSIDVANKVALRLYDLAEQAEAKSSESALGTAPQQRPFAESSPNSIKPPYEGSRPDDKS